MTDAEKALNALDAWIISRSTGDAAIESDYAKKMVPAVRKALQRLAAIDRENAINQKYREENIA